jgi:hypothetical protein
MSRPRHRLNPVRAGSRRAILAGIGVAATALVWLGVAAQEDKQEAELQRDVEVAEKQSLAAQIRSECESGDLRGLICARASEIAAEPVPGPQGEPGRPPSPEEIQAAVDAYLEANPPPAGRPPTASEVAAAVSEYLIENPPEPGRPPTAEEIAAAVETYFAANPPPAGPAGEPGRGPTAEEIRAAVDAYLAENPPPAGPPGAEGPTGPTGPAGPAGPQGVGVQSVRAEDRDDGCVLVFVFVNPATGTTSERDVAVADGVCDDFPPRPN